MAVKYTCNMDVSLVLLLCVFWFPGNRGLEENPPSNFTNSTNDMYVIHATVYQVGIITNKSDEEIANMTGNQEALSFYHSNGSAVDLSGIPAPLMTNVTAQSAVAMAPAPIAATSTTSGNGPLALLEQFASGRNRSTVKRSVSENSLGGLDENSGLDGNSRQNRDVYMNLYRRSAGNSSEAPSIKVVKETALIPPEVGLQSIGLPDLIGLNASVASVPLPIPNTSVVRYAKINTLVKAP